MSNSQKNAKHREKVLVRTNNESQTTRDLKSLLSLLETTQTPEGESSSSVKPRSSALKRSQLDSPSPSASKSELNVNLALQKFSEEFENQRCFSSHRLHKLFCRLLVSLLENRLCRAWVDSAAPEAVLRVLTCLRILVRDAQLQRLFQRHRGVAPLSRVLASVSAAHISGEGRALDGQTLVTMTYMIQMMSASDELRPHFLEVGVHKVLVTLLASSDSDVLRGALLALSALAHPDHREQIGELHVVENLLVILQDHDLLSKRMCAELLRRLSSVRDVREQLRTLGGVPTLLSLLHGHHLKLLWSVCWVLVQICEDSEARAEIRSWGGVQQLLRLLNSDRQFELETLPTAGRVQSLPLTEEQSSQPPDSVAALQAACIAALTELSLDGSCAHSIVQENGVFIISKFILAQTSTAKGSLQLYSFRALRFLFGAERNRRLFKRLLPPELFEMFIDVGHYVRDLSAYRALQDHVSLCPEEELETLRGNIAALDQNRPPLRVIGEYSVLEHLGTGAFGTVFKVRRHGSQMLSALKEVNLHNPAFGKDKTSRDNNVEKIISELSIIREQMSHPNIVRYHRTFVEGEKLNIVMELIEGVPLAEHLTSVREKGERLDEERVWNIFIQMCLALRYLHKDKQIVHRDLSPNNIMLSDEDKVTITDFGLAKQKQENGKLTSVVGTILYSCPEVVKSEPYGEKADVWALGCVLYQMVTLQPPFYSCNMLRLANKIVEAQYDPVDSSSYSDRVIDMIRWCLSPEPEERPDIVEVSGRISDLLLRALDQLHASHNALQRKARHDRRKDVPRIEAWARDQNSAPGPGDGLDDKNEPPDPKPSGSSAEPLGSTSAVALCVAHRNVRQIDDPANRLLLQLHKLIFIAQLPPAPRHDHKRHLVERFKKALFNKRSDPHNLKRALSKLLQSSSEPVEISSAPHWSLLQHPDSDSAAGGVSYEQMQGYIEDLLQQNHYYTAAHSDTTAIH